MQVVVHLALDPVVRVQGDGAAQLLPERRGADQLRRAEAVHLRSGVDGAPPPGQRCDADRDREEDGAAGTREAGDPEAVAADAVSSDAAARPRVYELVDVVGRVGYGRARMLCAQTIVRHRTKVDARR